MSIENAQIEALGYELVVSLDASPIEALLRAAGLERLRWSSGDDPSCYLMAQTSAGGVAACAGWTRMGDAAVMHSLAVAPPSRGSGVGGSLFAQAVGALMDERPVETIYLVTTGARRFFGSFGFEQIEPEEAPAEVRKHPSMLSGMGDGRILMARRYKAEALRGLDQRAFRLMRNATPDAALPPGSILYMQQRDTMLVASYRGGPVVRGQLLGDVDQDRITYMWQVYLQGQALLQGRGAFLVRRLSDGRRELHEEDSDGGAPVLVMREV
jgi:N-acetylglutamate synthase-like GNAT family acetyltransferase